MTKELYLAAGCFWGAEHFFKQICGVTFTEVGFANGHTPNPTYRQVYTDATGYAEAVHLQYDPLRVSLAFLLEMYFRAIDPTSLNKQGEDEGTRYRTGIYYVDAEDIPFINHTLAEESAKHERPLCVEVGPLQNFYPAEDCHQGYLTKNPGGYCHLPVALFEYARGSADVKTQQKSQQYGLLLKQFSALAAGETDRLALMANLVALIQDTFRFWWTGFYRVIGEELVLGPFQGPVACMRIGYGRGVCGTCWKENRALLVPDVDAFPGHIACSAASRSEIVVPLHNGGNVVAVLDIDSQYPAAFDLCDRHYLEACLGILP